MCLLSATGASYWLSTQRVDSFKLSDYTSYSCPTNSRVTSRSLRILSLSSIKAIEMANAFCAQPQIRKHYSEVVISWRPRGYLTAQDIVEQKYDLFLNRSYLMLGLVPDFYSYYTALYDTPGYAVYWVSKTSQPELTPAYFADKSVGFLEDFYSQSFFLLPSNSLMDADITLREEQKKFYPNLKALYQAFTAGEVDLITAPDIQSLGIDQPFHLKIARDAPSVTWFIKKSDVSTEIGCAMMDALGLFDSVFDKQGSIAAQGINCT